jgi:RHS repeat-associated protein
MLKPAAANTQWFHGKSLDPDTGMEDFGARNYDPVLGRFLSIDPVDFTEKNIHSFNRYAYGNNNPLKYKDPDGRFPVALIALAVLKAADVAMTAYDTYKSYQEGGAREAGKTLAIAAAMSAIPGGKAAGKAVHAAEEVAVAAKGGIGRSGAFREAKRDLGIPRLQDPEAVSHIPMTDRTGKNILGENGRPIMTREYTYKRPDGSTVVIQEHSAGHQFGAGGVGDQGSHFNVRPPENTRSGSVPGTKDHYSW